MMRYLFKPKTIRFILLLVLMTSLTGCLHWLRAFQTYLQLNEFDKYFIVNDNHTFSVYFNKPILYSQDFILLSKLEPSSKQALKIGEKWRYRFHKVNAKQQRVQPELSFFFDLDFNQQKRISSWIFSPLFLEIAPPKFLEASLRSLAGGKIDKEKKQLKAHSHVKIEAQLPKREYVIKRLGEPIEIKDEGEQAIYFYHFLLDSPMIEKGYEERALSVVKLIFDKKTHELTQMAGRFAGLKISIKYRRYLTAE